MEALRDSASLQSYAQKDPLVEYKRLSYESYEELLSKFNDYVLDFIMKVEKKEVKVEAKPSIIISGEKKKVGRNDPCPCGSGKKYKQCHGRTN